MPERTTEDLQAEIAGLKARVLTYESNLGKLKHPIPSFQLHDHSEFFGGRHLLFALLGDTHMGSKYERLHELDAAYKIIETEGVQAAYHQGDIIDGSIHMHPGMVYEQISRGVMEQVGHVAKHYPKSDKVKTYFISGNHDDSFLKADGVEVGLLISQRRPDLVYLGQEETDVLIAPRVLYRMRHGSGGGAYAKSYRLQKTIDSWHQDDRPAITSQGHIHTAFYMQNTGVEAVQVPCFQGQSLWLKSKGLQPTIGFWLVEIHIKDGTVNRFKPELITFK